MIQIESVDQGISLGRMDQYLYPLYCELKSRGEIDDDEVRDLFAAFCIKLSEVIPLFSRRATEYYAGLPSGQALTIGGVDAEGNDAANELSFLLLDVMEGFKTRQPNWHARISRASSPEFVRRVVEVDRRRRWLAGPLQRRRHHAGHGRLRDNAQEKVWNYATVGCVEPALSCESFTSSDAAIFNLAISMEWLLGGRRRLAKGRVVASDPGCARSTASTSCWPSSRSRPQSGSQQLKSSLDAIERAGAEHYPTPFSSLLIGGCIENASDSTAAAVHGTTPPGSRPSASPISRTRSP